MALYRKRPVVIEAIRFDPSGEHRMALPPEVIGIPFACADNWDHEGCKFFIQTLEGPVQISPGDYIVTGVAGEIYPCRGDIFEATYDLVTSYELERDPE